MGFLLNTVNQNGFNLILFLTTLMDGYDEFLKKKVEESSLVDIASKYDKYAILNYARLSNFDASDIELLYVISNYLDWGNSTDLKWPDLKEMFSEVTRIKNELTPYNDIFMVNANLRNIRAIRPFWLTIPIYKEILLPLDDQVKINTGFSAKEIFDSIFDVLLYLDSIQNGDRQPHLDLINNDQEPEPLKMLWKKYSANLSELRSFGDIWDKSLITGDGNFRVALSYKLPETIYRSLCRELSDTYRKFGDKKGRALENVISNEFESFFKSYHLKKRIRLREDSSRELDLAVEGNDFALLVESKSASFRNKSSDNSVLNAISDLSPLVKGISQLLPFFKAFRSGNKEVQLSNGDIEALNSHQLVLGAVITDDIYTTIALDSVYKSYSAKDKTDETLQNYPIWIGSIFDLKFLLQVSQTPSVLFHYIAHFRSQTNSHLMEEADSWQLYARLTEDSAGIMAIGNQVLPSDLLWGYEMWNLLKKGKNHYVAPTWLKDSLNELKSLDKEGRILESMKIIDKEWRMAVREFYLRYEIVPIIENTKSPRYTIKIIKYRDY